MKAEIAEYLSHLRALGRLDRTISEYGKRLRVFMGFAAKRRARSVRDVTVDLVRDYHDAMIGRGLESGSRKTVIGTVRSFMSWCHSQGLILSDVALRVELPIVEEKLPPTPLTDRDMKRLFALAETPTIVGKRNLAIIEVFYACGLRAHELLGLNVGDIDPGERTVFVRGKGAKERVVPIHERALKVVAEYLTARGGKPRKKSPLFVTHANNKSRRFDMNALWAVIKQLKKKLGKHLNPHLFRHTFAVHLLRNGADLRYVQALLGHESPDTTAMYLGLVKQDLKREYDRAIEEMLA